MRPFIVALLVVVLPQFAPELYAQPQFNWSRRYETELDESQFGARSFRTDNGGFALLANYQDDEAGGITFALADSLGEMILTTHIENEDPPPQFPGRGPFSFYQLSSGGFIAARTFTVDNFSRIRLIQLTSDGEVAWSRAYDDGEENEAGFGAFCETSDSTYLMLGVSDWTWLTVWEITNDGDMVAFHHFDELYPYGRYVTSALTSIADGGFIIAGERGPEEGIEKMFLTKLTSEYEIGWEHVYGDSAFNRCRTFLSLDQGGFILAGESFRHGDGRVRFPSFFMTDNEGEEVMRRCYNNRQNYGFSAVIELSDAGLVFACQSGLLKTNLEGDSVWALECPEEVWTPITLLSVAENELSVSGVGSGEDVYLHKLTLEPNSVSHNNQVLRPQNLTLLSTYPNPFNSSLNITWEGVINRRATLSVFDGVGREVCLPQFIEANSRKVVWDAGAMPAGNYFVNLKTPQGAVNQSVILIK